MADWEEIKRLAADFQRAQLSSTVQRLSERNCIEIVQKLIDQNLINVIYTTDGKEYLTHQELAKEIREELQAQRGRVNLVDLQAALNVDFSHIERKVNDVVKSDGSLRLILGQLIDQSYVESLAEEINDKLQEQGQITIAELTKTYDLPSDFIAQTVSSQLGRVIKGQVDDDDRNLLYTDAFVNRHTAIIRGAFSAITRPVPLISVMSRYGLNERLFYTILEELVSSKQLAGTLAGGRQERAQYIPDIYTRAQSEWVDNFLKQNGYLDYDSLVRLGISDAKSYIKKRYKTESLQYLSSCCINCHLVDRIEAEIDEALTNGGWFDVLPSLPSICTPSDASHLLSYILRHKPGVIVFCDSIVTSEGFLSVCHRPFNQIIQTKAETVARSNPGLLTDKSSRTIITEDISNTKEDRKEQRRKKASAGKSGGGTQGREVKTKSTKKKTQRGRDRDDSDDDTATARGRHTEHDFLTLADIQETLSDMADLQDCPEELIVELSETLHRPLNKEFLEAAKSIFLQSTGGATRRKEQGELSEKITSLWTNVKLFEKGIKLFPEEPAGLITRHMLRTICTDITNLVFSSIAGDLMLSSQDEYTAESRSKLLSKVPDEKVKGVLTKLHGSLNGKNLEDFYNQLDQACGQEVLDIILRKPDKKKERQIVFHHRQALTDQLRHETDPALALHLACVLLYQVFTQCMLHAPGRCVPQIIALLKAHLAVDNYRLFMAFQELVMRQLRAQNDAGADQSSPEYSEVTRELEELLPKIKDIALNTKKGAANQVED